MKRTKGSRSEIGMIYQYAVTALFAAELSTDANVDNYIIYSSERSAGKFDDIILRIKLKEQLDWYVSLIQVKYKETKKLNVSDVLKGKSVEYFLSDYIDSFTIIMSDPTLECRRGIPSSNIRFGIFCDKGIQMPVFLRKKCTFQLTLSKYTEKNTVKNTLLPFSNKCWKFTCQDLESSEYQQFFNNCYLWLEQPNYSKIDKHLRTICDIHDAKDIINYVKDYFNNDYLYTQGLHKEVFEIELQRIRLNNFIPPLTPLLDLVNDNRVTIWNQITLAHDITIVNHPNDIETEYCLNSCIMHKLNLLLNTNIKWDKFTIQTKCLDTDTINKFVSYSKTRPLRYWIFPPNTIHSLLIELWKCGALPLMLKIQNNFTLFENYMHLARSYIIFYNQQKLPTETSNTKLKIFKCLSSIADNDLRDQMLQSTQVSLQGRKPYTLKDLVGDDMELMATFSSAYILNMLKKRTASLNEACLNGTDYLAFVIEDSNCATIVAPLECPTNGNNFKIYCHPTETQACVNAIKNHANYQHYTICRLRRTSTELELVQGNRSKLNQCFMDQYGHPLYSCEANQTVPIIGQSVMMLQVPNYIRRSLNRATVSKSFINSQEKKICLLSGELNSFSEKLKLSEVDINASEMTLTQNQCYFVRTNSKDRYSFMMKLSHLGYPVLDINVRNGEMELLRYRNCKKLSAHISYKGKPCAEDDFFCEIESDHEDIVVITGVGGIGKSSLLKRLCHIWSTQDYILFYDLLHFQSCLFRNKDPLADPFNFIIKEIHKDLLTRYYTFLHLLRKKNRLLLVLDSFDEIILACEQQILEFIRRLIDTGIKIIIATRLESCSVLIDTFNVRVIKINPLDSSAEREYLSHWRLNKIILAKVPSEFTANPLYLNLLGTICLDQENLLYITRFSIFEEVVDMRVQQTLKRNSRVIHEYEVEHTISLFENLALVAMFGKDTVKQELMWICDETMLDYTKFGIVTRFDDEMYPIFEHHTFVEFLIAQWIVKAQHIKVYKNFAKFIYKKMFNEHKLHLLNILIEDVEVYQTIMYGDMAQVEHMILSNSNYLSLTDQLGRTILHIAALCCRNFWCRFACYRITEVILKLMRQNHHNTNKCDTITGWNWTDYSPPEMVEYMTRYGLINGVTIYSSVRVQSIERCVCTVFPLPSFSVVFQWAIDCLSIETIGNLLLLQNYDNTKFYYFYQACSNPSVIHATPFTTNFHLKAGLTPLHVACIYGSIQIMQHLIATGADVNAVDSFGCTPLHYSIIRCSLSPTADNLLSNLGISRYSVADTVAASNEEKPLSADAFKFLLSNGVDLDVPSRKMTAIYLAVLRRNINVIKVLLESGANANVPCSDGDTPLHAATRMGDLNAVQWLLNYNADQHIKNIDGITAHDIAINANNVHIVNLFSKVEGHKISNKPGSSRFFSLRPEDKKYIVEMMDWLLSETEANIHKKYATGETLFHLSAYTGNMKHLRLLIEAGLNINLRNKHGRTPMHFATLLENTHVVRLLLENGADANIADIYGDTPLHIAIRKRNMDIVKELIGKATKFNLQAASTDEFVGSEQLLLETGMNVNVQNNHGISPLIEAANVGNIDIIKLLLKRGANIDIQNKYDSTALHVAVDSKIITTVELILDGGADLNIVDQFNNTPLHLAIFHQHFDIAKLLLSKGASLDVANVLGFSPLHLAIAKGDIKITQLLLENGANINSKAYKASTPLYFATYLDHLNIVKLLLFNSEIDANLGNMYGSTPLHAAVLKENVYIVMVLLEHGVNVNISDETGETPLHHGIRKQHKRIVELLLDNGASVNIEHRSGETPFIWAIHTNDLDIVSLLLNKNADVNTRNCRGITAISWAIYKGFKEIIKLLLDNGVDVNVQDKYLGLTPLHLAISNEDTNTVAMLLETGANINIIDRNGNTPLDSARLKVIDHITDELRKKEGSTAVQINNDYVIMHMHRLENTKNIIKLLLKKGALSNKEHGDETFCSSGLQNNIDVIKVGLNQGENSQGSVARTSEALILNDENILKLLMDKVNSVKNFRKDDSFNQEVLEDDSSNATLLRIKENAGATGEEPHGHELQLKREVMFNISAKDDDVACFQRAICEGHVDIVEKFLRFGMDVNIQFENKRTPLRLAVSAGYVEMVAMLLNNGANVHFLYTGGVTILHVASYRGYEDIARLLIDAGASVNAKDKNNKTPLDVATDKGRSEIVALMLNKGARLGVTDENK